MNIELTLELNPDRVEINIEDDDTKVTLVMPREELGKDNLDKFNRFLYDNITLEQYRDLEHSIAKISSNLLIITNNNFDKCYEMENIPDRVIDNEMYKKLLDLVDSK